MKYTLEKITQVAVKRGGMCLSPTYTDVRSKYLWECERGHQWNASATSVIRGSWCPKCAGFKSLDDWYDLSAKVVIGNGARLLTPKIEFIHPRPRNLSVECANGHRWMTSAYVLVEEGKWSRKCKLKDAGFKRRSTLEEMHQAAAKKGGKCLSTLYRSNVSHLLWECSHGHQWKAKPGNIKSGKWCPECMKIDLSNKFRRIDARSFYSSLAMKKGGKLISQEEPQNSHQHLLWECARGHQWKAKANNIQNGRWCPICSGGIGERVARIYFETLWGESFPSSWPDWLRKDGTKRQLDGYCENLGLAFEHQGRQHYEQINSKKFQRVRLDQQISGDLFKLETCLAQGIKLFQIPEIPSITPLNKIKDVIREQCVALAVPIPSGFEEREVDLKGAWDYDLMMRLHAAASTRGGKCLGNDFIGVREKYLWECEKGHTWDATAESIIRSKSWCPECAFEKTRERIRNGYKLPVAKPDFAVFEKMKQVAMTRGGEILSTEYTGVNNKHHWKCALGHTWEASGSSILWATSWCRKCSLIKRRGLLKGINPSI